MFPAAPLQTDAQRATGGKDGTFNIFGMDTSPRNPKIEIKEAVGGDQSLVKRVTVKRN